MRVLRIMLFLFCIPFLGALGHDLYVTYQDEDFSKQAMFSDIGYLWVTYHPDSFRDARRGIDPETWQTFFSPVLQQKTVLVSLFPLLLIAVLMLVMKAMETIKTRKLSKVPSGFRFKSGIEKKEARFMYKRK